MAENRNTILYLDDEIVNLFLFEKIFERKYRILCASTGYEALDIVRKDSTIDVIISDMRMPEMSGLQFVQQARKITKSIPYFILTGFELNPDLETALNQKLINMVFKKPLDYEIISQSIDKWITKPGAQA